MNDLVKGHIIFDHDGTLSEVTQKGMALFSGMYDLLNKLHSENYKLYVWTKRSRNGVINSLKEGNVLELFSEFSCSDDPFVKPHPMGPMTMLSGIDKNNILHIGDSRDDLEGAKMFGVDFVFAAWGDIALGEHYKKVTPQVAFNLQELKTFIDKKFNK